MNNKKVILDANGYVSVTFDGSVAGLAPAGSRVMDAPGDAPNGFVWRLLGDSMLLEADRRGQVFESPDGAERITLRELGEVPPAGWQPEDVGRRRLEDMRAHAWSSVKARRDAAETSGFWYMGKLIDSDARSVQRITGAVQAAQEAMRLGQPFAIAWTCADNSVLEVDADGMQGMPLALAMYADSLHEKARRLRAAIATAETIEALEAITWDSP